MSRYLRKDRNTPDRISEYSNAYSTSFFIIVLPPFGIRVGIMSHAADGLGRIFRMFWLAAKGIHMDSHSSPIPRNCEIFFRDEARF